MELELLLKIALVGLVVWLLIEFVPMPAHVQKVLIVAGVLIAILLALPLLRALIAAV